MIDFSFLKGPPEAPEPEETQAPTTEDEVMLGVEQDTTTATQMQSVDPFDPEPARAKLRPYEIKVNKMLAQAGSLEIIDEATMGQAVAMGNQAKQLDKKIDIARKGIISKHYQFFKAVNATAKPFGDTLKRIENTLKNKIRVRMNQQEQKRREREADARGQNATLQAKLDTQAELSGTEPIQLSAPIMPGPKIVSRTESGSASLRKKWTFEVENVDEVPVEYLEVVNSKVNAAIKAGVRTISGLRIYKDTTTVFRQ